MSQSLVKIKVKDVENLRILVIQIFREKLITNIFSKVNSLDFSWFIHKKLFDLLIIDKVLKRIKKLNVVKTLVFSF